MAKIDENGHRSRIRSSYISNNAREMPDHNLLELFLSLFIRRKDVKRLSYDLMSHFGSFENVMCTDYDELLKVSGVGKNVAAAICLAHDINKRFSPKNDILIDSFEKARNYCQSIIDASYGQKLIVITLSNCGYVINTHIFPVYEKISDLDNKNIVLQILDDNASSIITALNHAEGKPAPTAQEYNFIISVNSVLKRTNVDYFDHLVFTDGECLSIKGTAHIL